jgi:carboxyl-terminal processing protease
MLNSKKYSLLLVVFIWASLISCKDKNVDPTDETAGSYPAVNGWLYEIMNDAYFWYDKMPAQSSLDAQQSPVDYLEKLVYQRSTVDRFSMVTDNIHALQNQFDGVSKTFGISYSLSFIDDGKSNIGMFLNYVVKGSPAEIAGLKRGDILLKANGTQLTKDNYSRLLDLHPGHIKRNSHFCRHKNRHHYQG